MEPVNIIDGLGMHEPVSMAEYTLTYAKLANLTPEQAFIHIWNSGMYWHYVASVGGQVYKPQFIQPAQSTCKINKNF